MDKQQSRKIIKNTFENPFDKGRFDGFVRNLLNHIEDAPFTYKGNYIPDAYKQYIKTLERIGKFSDGENSLDILVITLQNHTSLERARTMQRNFIAWYLNGSRGGNLKDAALVAYVSPDQADWRFSLVKMDYKFEKTKTGKVKVKEAFTPARRWSFLVGANEKSHTAQSRLVNILANDEQAPTLAELENAFDIETVTKEFFLKYRELFLRAKEALDNVARKDPKIKADFEAKGVDTVNFAKKLLGQIVFLYFLQKKGWFGVGRDDDWGTGSKHFLRSLFEKKHSEYHNFFNDILEPLFYDALRIDRSHDDGYYSRFNCKIPFLNGGLFDPIDNYDWVHTDINLPNDLFSNFRNTKEGDEGDGILDVLDRYNFTVREDEPLEKEVAIDPELLGKAYEKFNAIRPDNFDDFTNAMKSGKKGEENKFNKKFGVYYTPREIVHYMCKQSLINYLYTQAEEAGLSDTIKKQEIEDLIEVGELITEHEATALIKQEKIKNGIQKSTEYKAPLSESIRENAAAIDRWLEEITVCDPAVGSGAFSVGMMNEIVRARNVLSVFLQSNTDIPVCDSDSTTTDKNVCTTITRRNLPHWTKANAVYWITFRLADSMPREKLNEWKAERDHWKSQHPEPWSDEDWKEYNERFGERLEKWLDAGYGSCALSKPVIRKILQECLFRFNGERLRLYAGVIMPNHVHLLLEPLAGYSLSDLLKGIKGASSMKINQILGTTGSKFWMDESYDHIVRSEAQYQHFIRYIAENPVKANLSEDKYWLYIGDTGISACDKTQTRMSVPRSEYEFKRRCIEHSLYGVDIDPGAVEIAKLRLWLSLVVDEEDIKNIKPLPNLDYKIVCGNSLRGVEKNLFNSALFSKLEELKPLYFNETNPSRKQEYRNQINELISQITNGHKEFDFEVYFSEVFHNKVGFDVVIANPPYGLLNKRQNKTQTVVVSPSELKYFKTSLEYEPARGGMINIFKLFILKSIYLLNTKGTFTEIFPLAFIGDTSASQLRKYILQNCDLKLIEAFPERDNINKRVFSEVKMSVCIVVLSRQKSKANNRFALRINDNRFIDESIQKAMMDYKLIELFDDQYFTIPLLSSNDVNILSKIYNQSIKLKAIGHCYTGEVDLTLGKEYISNNKNDPLLLRGAGVDRYLLRKKMSQGDTLYIKEKKYLSNIPQSRRSHVESKRIVMQGLTGVNENIRLKMSIIEKGIYCANSVNYLVLDKKEQLNYFLGLLNSKVINYVFKKFSTNSNVNGYEVDNLPIPQNKTNDGLNIKEKIINATDKILAITKDPDYLQNPAKQAQVKEYERQIDRLVYELYGLTEEEIRIVEGEAQ